MPVHNSGEHFTFTSVSKNEGIYIFNFPPSIRTKKVLCFSSLLIAQAQICFVTKCIFDVVVWY